MHDDPSTAPHPGPFRPAHARTAPPGTDAAAPRPLPPDDDLSGGRHKILRFHRGERHIHWAIAIPFLVCWVTAVVLVFVYNPAPARPLRALFSWTHRIGGICLTLLPILAVLRSTRDIRVHFSNVRQAWVWTLQDIRWLSLLAIAAVSKRVKLPEQGKFNAAEKLNFMVLMACYPLYIATGVTIWLTDGAFLSWLLHFFMALVGTPLVLGHIYMATVNPSSRVGLQGMISGYVDRKWAKHHYGRWYREQFERDEDAAKKIPSRPTGVSGPPPDPRVAGSPASTVARHRPQPRARNSRARRNAPRP